MEVKCGHVFVYGDITHNILVIAISIVVSKSAFSIGEYIGGFNLHLQLDQREVNLGLVYG